MMKVAIVILNWNGKAMLAKYLPSVLAHSGDEATVVVADNGSTDDSMEWLSREYPEIRRLLLGHNYGFAEGYNRALQQVDADYYVLLNSDVEVTSHWLSPLLEFMESHPDCAAVQPKLHAVANHCQFEYAGAAGGYIDRYGYPFCRGRVFDTVEDDNGQYDSVAEVHWVTGACMMVRAADYWKAGGLDGTFFAHQEEIDFCWRLRRMGLKLYCIPGSLVYHVGGGTLPKGNPMKTFLNFRNNLTMLWKNLPPEERRHVMLLRWFLDYLAAFQTLLFNGNYRDFLAIFRARKAFGKIRKELVAKSEKDSLAYVKLKPYSILWNYYIKGRRQFKEIDKKP